jgi:hypothetical protein
MARLPSASRPERRAACCLRGASGRLQPDTERQATSPATHASTPSRNWFALPSDDHAQELVLYALGLPGHRLSLRRQEPGSRARLQRDGELHRRAGERPQLPYNAAGIAERTRPVPATRSARATWCSSTPWAAATRTWASTWATAGSSTPQQPRQGAGGPHGQPLLRRPLRGRTHFRRRADALLRAAFQPSFSQRAASSAK